MNRCAVFSRGESDNPPPMSIWSTGTVGLNLGVFGKDNLETNSTTKLFHRPHGRFRMSQIGDDLRDSKYLSWRKLHLSRAKLKASSKTSALLSGFAMVAMVELQISNDSKISSEIMVSFAIITTLLVAVHMLALMISTCILPNIEAICSLDSINLVDESPHERLHWYIETAWAFSTLLGLLLFLAEIGILCWMKFSELNRTAAWSASVILIPILFVFLAFAMHFYRSLVAHKYERRFGDIQELEKLKEKIEQGDVEHSLNGVDTDLLGGIHIV